MKTISTTITNGVQTVFPVSFALGYIDKAHVFVYTGDVYTEQVGYTWVNETTIETSTVLPANTSLKIRRVIPKTQLINDYTNNAILEEQNLDDSFKQAMMWLEEIEDGFMSSDDVWVIRMSIQMLGDIDMNGHKIINLPAPTSPTEPVRLTDFQVLLAEQGSTITRQIVSGTTYTVTAADHTKHLYFTSNTDVTVTVGVATGTTASDKSLLVFITQLGDGAVRLVPDVGVSLIYPTESTAVTYSKGATLALESVEDTHWLLVGNMGY